MHCGLFPQLPANSDHKIVTLQLRPNLTPSVKRKRCPVSFLKDDEAVDKIQSKLEEIAGYSGWGEAMCVIQHGAFKYKLSHRETGDTELQALMHESSVNTLPAVAWEFLKSKGYELKSSEAAYSLLVSLASREDGDRTGIKMLEKLKLPLADPFESKVHQKRQDIWRLVKQLQHKRCLLSLRNRLKCVLRDANAIAQEITGVVKQHGLLRSNSRILQSMYASLFGETHYQRCF